MRHFSKVLTGFTIVFALFIITNVNVKAAEDIPIKCEYEPVQGVNPDYQTMNCLLTETALANNIPPEIVKAIAEGESGDWKHFDENGEVIITDDNGIGIMQITNKANYDEDRLKNDILYNIQSGVEILDYMFERADLPTINGGESDVIEHWYFAVMAYNGTKPVNSPIVQATGEKNTNAYQEKIFNIIENFNLVELKNLPFTRDDFEYDSNSDDNIEFVTMNYDFDLPLTKSRHHFQKGYEAKATSTVNVRTGPTTDSTSKGKLSAGEVVKITGAYIYEEVKNRKNHFVWYPIKRKDGTTGYVASSYLKFNFNDVPIGHYAEEEIYYLYDRSILLGIGDGKFGLEQELTRWQAVLLLNRANHVSLENRPDPGFTDVPEDYQYYKDIAAAVDEGLFNGVSETEFNPNATLTRREMAVVLQRLYEFPDTSSKHPFTDVPDGKWYSDAINRLYHAGITDGMTATTFGPLQNVTREQFAVFLVRSMNEEYRMR